jgi:phosphatidylethanolamine-binding protein (PEBP) family uncharacterized protein
MRREKFSVLVAGICLSVATIVPKQQLLDAMKGHVLGEAELMGRYKR